MRRARSTPRRRRARSTVAVAACLIAGAPAVARACSVCFGNPDSPHTQGMNNAILFLLAVIGAVLVCFAAFFLHLRRMARLARAGHGSDLHQSWGSSSGRGSPRNGSSRSRSSRNGSSRADGTRGGNGARF